MLGGGGSQTSSLAYGGGEPGASSAKTEEWDGSSWTEVGDLATARDGLTGATGTSNTTGFAATGGDPAAVGAEDWTMGQNVEVITD